MAKKSTKKKTAAKKKSTAKKKKTSGKRASSRKSAAASPKRARVGKPGAAWVDPVTAALQRLRLAMLTR